MPDEDTEQLRKYVRALLEESGRGRVREVMESETGYDAALWTRCAQELGLQGLALAERVGGSGAGLAQLGVVFEELGRGLACMPFLSTVALASTALSQLPDTPGVVQALTAVTAGGTVATLAWGGGRPQSSTVRWRDGRLSGMAEIVLDGAVADTLLVAARTGDGVGLFRVHPGADGLVRTPLPTMDLTRRLARLDFAATPAETLSADAGGLLARTMDTASLLLAAEQVGGARAVLDSAVAYAMTRVQFGRKIGSFQAVKHRCADLLVEVESARSAVHHALYAADADPAVLPLESALAAGLACDAYASAAAANLQIHGGIGFTWEHDAHLYLKRARSSALLFGTAVAHRRRLAEHLGLAAGAPR